MNENNENNLYQYKNVVDSNQGATDIMGYQQQVQPVAANPVQYTTITTTTPTPMPATTPAPAPQPMPAPAIPVAPQPVQQLQQQPQQVQQPVQTMQQGIVQNINVVEQPQTVMADTSNKTFLVVDDNKLNLKVAAKMLANYGYNIETANSGFECLNGVNNGKKYDLIFMDIMMPEMDGVETMHKLKDSVNFTTPVIALTADAMEGSREKYLSEGFDEYFSKPIVKDTLEHILRKFNALA